MFNSYSKSVRHGVIAVFGMVCFSGVAQAATDPVVFSFATVGDSRQDPVAPDASTLPVSAQDQTWLQNTKAFSRIIRTIQSQKANMLFFNGDMIMGYGNAIVPADTSSVTAIANSDAMQFYRQYAFWRGMVAPLMETGTYVVPVPGNHEVQCKACGKIAKQVNEDAWRANMGDLIIDQARATNLLGTPVQNFDVNNHPVTSDMIGIDGADAGLIQTDQSKLSYSFDVKDAHFTIVNTDAVGNDGHAPVRWLSADLAAAAQRGATHFFVFGHKPAYSYDFGTHKISGLDAFPANQKSFWDVIEQYGATYFCGHEHIFNMMQPRLTTNPAGSAWQVLVGSGGSPFETATATANPNDRKYAWANVRIFQSGKVQIDAYGFDANYGPTSLLQSVVLSH